MRLLLILAIIGLFTAVSSLDTSSGGATADASARSNLNPSDEELSSDVLNRAVRSDCEKRSAGEKEPLNQAIEDEADPDVPQRVHPYEPMSGSDTVFSSAVLEQLKRIKRQEYCNGRYSQTDRNAILQYHNDMRSRIARGQYVVRGQAKSPAVNMRRMYYSCLLENSAQDVANRCTFAHSNRDGRNIGENIYRFRTPLRASPNPIPVEGTGSNACKAWEVEFEQFGWPTNLFTTYSLQIGIGHATQMAWWKTTTIGCGVAQCFDGSRQIILAVCHYRDTGNWFNEEIYKSGPTCSECGDGYRCETSTGLCIV